MRKPFQELGGELKAIRQKKRESVAEVSGAVEIDTTDLERIESGQVRPSEDVLMLLINHFGIQDDQAVELWELAGYDGAAADKDSPFDANSNHAMLVMMALDARILYTDATHINANKSGVVFNFLQNSNKPGQRVPVARVGMSYIQAQAFLKNLQSTLEQVATMNQPKRLPAPKQNYPKNKKSSQS